jgi:hypothetical protein
MEALLKKLEYSRKWLDYGFLGLATLEEQGSRLASGEDSNTEHYRYHAFCSILSSRDRLSDEEVNHYIELALEDPDQNMGYAALRILAEWPNLDESGYQKLSSHEAFQPAWIRKALLWGRAVRDVKASRLTPESCDFYLEAGNVAVQGLMLDFAGISRDQIERLTVIGKTRAVRNMAAAMLRMRRWRKMGAVDARAERTP